MMCRDPNDYVRETKKDIFKSNYKFLYIENIFILILIYIL